MENNEKTYTAAEVEAIKDAAYRDGYCDGFQEAMNLTGNPIVVLEDSEVMDKIKNNLDAFLIQLKW